MTTPPTNEGRKFPIEVLTADEVRRLIATASGRSPSGIRTRALIGVMFGAGLRLAEALALRPKDYDPTAEPLPILRVQLGKGGKFRTPFVTGDAPALLDRWLDRRREVGLNGRHPIFATYETGNLGSSLDPRYVRQVLQRLADKAGIDKRVHPHGLRHSHAYALAQAGVPLHAIQAQLGHSSLAITDRYIRHMTPADVGAFVSRLEW